MAVGRRPLPAILVIPGNAIVPWGQMVPERNWRYYLAKPFT